MVSGKHGELEGPQANANGSFAGDPKKERRRRKKLVYGIVIFSRTQ